MPPDRFGRDLYRYIDGLRYRIGMIRTIRPRDDESDAAFERRMDQMAIELGRMTTTVGVSLDFEVRRGKIVECIVTVGMTPVPAPLLAAA